jgi:probable phosphoglycerate mutase
MKLYFIRHGESEANRLHSFSNRGLGYPLTPDGQLQALQLAASLRDEWAPLQKSGRAIHQTFTRSDGWIDWIITSPLLRALQTAEILAQELADSPEAALPVEVSESLREFDCGILEGRSDSHSWLLFSELVEDWLDGRERHQRLPGGESFAEIEQRFVPFIQELLKKTDPQARILLVSHGGLLRCMLPLVLDNIDFQFTSKKSLGNCEMVLAEGWGERLVCRRWGNLRIDF